MKTSPLGDIAMWLIALGAAAALLAALAWPWSSDELAAHPLRAGSACVLPSPDPLASPQVWISGGGFRMGGGLAYPEEGPAVDAQVQGFWMDRHEVSNRQFAAFVQATGYRTLAERGNPDSSLPAELRLPGAAVFQPPTRGESYDPFQSWWAFVPGADWRHPGGPGTTLAGLDDHPVVHVAYEDALAYAQWLGRDLPTEAEFEYAARSSSREDSEGRALANTWQGLFPFEDSGADGFRGLAPVGCFPANAQGLHDLLGNVWEWTKSPYYPSHRFAAAAAHPEGYDPQRPGEAVAVIKGGSYLCAANYCLRYRPEARQGHSKGLGTSHIGFRTVLRDYSSSAVPRRRDFSAAAMSSLLKPR